MSIDKSELKKAVLLDVGADVEDMMEGAQAQLAEHRGSKRALRETALKLGAIAKAINDELDAGKLDDYVGETLKIAEYAKRQVQRCVEALLTASKHEENCELAATGAVGAVKAMMARVGKKMADEDRKISAVAAVETASASGEIVTRPAGVRPALGIAAQRKAEAAAEKAAETKPKKTRKASAKNGLQDASHT
jgi:hypothetical protein